MSEKPPKYREKNLGGKLAQPLLQVLEKNDWKFITLSQVVKKNTFCTVWFGLKSFVVESHRNKAERHNQKGTQSC